MMDDANIPTFQAPLQTIRTAKSRNCETIAP